MALPSIIALPLCVALDENPDSASPTSSFIFTKLDSKNSPLSPDIVNVQPQSKMMGYIEFLMDKPNAKFLCLFLSNRPSIRMAIPNMKM